MTDAERDRLYRQAQSAILKQRSGLLRDTLSDILALLKRAQAEIKVALASAPSDYHAWFLPQLQAEIDRVLGQLGTASAGVLISAADEAWAMGQAFVTGPLAAGGLSMVGMVPHLDLRQLVAMKSFMVDRIKDVSATAASAIKSELGMVVIGARPVSDAISRTQEILGGASRTRATTIVRTEVSRVFGTAANERVRQAAEAGVEMDKVWRRSGKLHPRISHAMADGQRVPYDQPFLVGGVRIMFPHDPAAPASHTINCGCVMIPRPRGWKTSKPDHKPFTEDELRRNPKLREIVESKGEPSLRELSAKTPDTLRAPRVREKIKALRKEIGSAEVEHAIILDADGNELLRKTGEADQVSFTVAELKLMKGAVAVHNHPAITSFSPADIEFAMHHQVAEMHVVDRLFRYSVRQPKAGWTAATWRDTVQPIYERAAAEVKREFQAALSHGLISEVQYDLNLHDEIWRRVNMQVDIGYRRRRRSDGEK